MPLADSSGVLTGFLGPRTSYPSYKIHTSSNFQKHSQANSFEEWCIKHLKRTEELSKLHMQSQRLYIYKMYNLVLVMPSLALRGIPMAGEQGSHSPGTRLLKATVLCPTKSLPMGSWSQTRKRTRAISGMWMVKVSVSSHTGLKPAGQTGHPWEHSLSSQGAQDTAAVTLTQAGTAPSCQSFHGTHLPLGLLYKQKGPGWELAGTARQALRYTEIQTSLEFLGKGDLRTILLKKLLPFTSNLFVSIPEILSGKQK